MRTLKLKHVDAFTTTPFGGNYAGVVLDAAGLTDRQMLLIARENNLSETAFVLPPTNRQADIQIRWFTPGEEVPLCGHATIAAFHALAEDGLAGMKTQGQHYFRLQTKSGILNVRVEKNFKGINVEFELPIPKFRRARVSAAAMKALGLKERNLDRRIPVLADSYLYVPVRTVAELHALTPDYLALAKVTKSMKVLGVSVFTLDTLESHSAVHSRFFAPGLGVQEDPVTGSANGPLGVYLRRYVEAQGIEVEARQFADGRIEYVGEQGDVLGRPGRVRIRLRTNDGNIESVAICGEAITMMNATMIIDREKP